MGSFPETYNDLIHSNRSKHETEECVNNTANTKEGTDGQT